jgi:ribonuclease HI
VDQATPWTPTIEKIALNLKRWEANHPTSEGRRLITQMIIGGMTQYLAKVQGIPETALKTLENLIRNFAWTGENKPTIAMSHMSNTASKGGMKVLDIYARNEAIQLTWIQSYLKMGESRPTWALIADELFRNNAPGEPKSLANDRNARINQFLQSWHSRSRNAPNNNDLNIPKDLKEMLKVAHKYNVKLEAIHPSPEVRADLPAIRNIQTKTDEKPDTLCDKFGKCLRNKHNVRSLEDIAAISENLPQNHKRNKKCKCTRCVEIRTLTTGSCKHPNKCIERVAALLTSINDKWNPTKIHPPEFFTNPEPEEVGARRDPDDEESIVHTLNPFCVEEELTNCFRVFTKPPQSQLLTSRATRTAEFSLNPIIAFTDGSCLNNGETTAEAGSGIWFGENDQRNTSLRVPGPNKSNQSAELYVILYAIQSTPHDRELIIKTDSMYAIQGLTKNLSKWENQGWMYSKHAVLFKEITAWIRHRNNFTKITWVKGHSGIRGNDEADRLANIGARKPLPPHDPIPPAPVNTIPSGAKLSALSQKDFYRGIKMANLPPPRRGTQLNLDRIQACATAFYNQSPTHAAIWKSLKIKEISKRVREFLWKSIHNAFKIGRFWDNIPNYENRGICAHCEIEESMEHIITECDAPGRETIWNLASELWKKRSKIPIPTNYGALLGCGLSNFTKDNGKPDAGLNRLFRIIVTESMHLIWKIRCERTITWNNDPSKFHTPTEIHNKWLQAINCRLRIDSVQTNRKIFKKKVIDPKLILRTWKRCLTDELNDTKNWCGKTGVLVGIKPKRPPGRNR